MTLAVPESLSSRPVLLVLDQGGNDGKYGVHLLAGRDQSLVFCSELTGLFLGFFVTCYQLSQRVKYSYCVPYWLMLELSNLRSLGIT